MTITINTDASYHPYYKVGAFAFWIVCKSGKTIHSGPLKKVSNSQDAELQCIANALHVVSKLNYPAIKHIYVNTDCKWGILAVTKGQYVNGCSVVVKKIHKIRMELEIKYGYSKRKWKSWGWDGFISWRYVPAHTEGNTKREWVNNRMDAMAKEALRKLISNL